MITDVLRCVRVVIVLWTVNANCAKNGAAKASSLIFRLLPHSAQCYSPAIYCGDVEANAFDDNGFSVGEGGLPADSPGRVDVQIGFEFEFHISTFCRA